MDQSPFHLFIKQQVERQSPKVFAKFIANHASEVPELIQRSIVLPAVAKDKQAKGEHGAEALAQFLQAHAQELAELLIKEVFVPSAEEFRLPRNGTTTGTRAPGGGRGQAQAERDEQMFEVLRKSGKAGASISEVAAATGFTVKSVRMRFWRLKKVKKIKVHGTTSNARYFLA